MRNVFLAGILGFIGSVMCPAQVAAQEMAKPNTPNLGVSWESMKTLLKTMKTDFQFTTVPGKSMVANSPSSRMTVSLFGSAKSTSRATIRYAVGSEANFREMLSIVHMFVPEWKMQDLTQWAKQYKNAREAKTSRDIVKCRGWSHDQAACSLIPSTN